MITASLASLLACIGMVPAAIASDTTSVDGGGLEECLSKNSKLAVLMLIDESKSLREFKDGASTRVGNDPLDSRVPALESVVRVLSSAVESSELLVGTGTRKLEVAIGVAGFGDGYNVRVPFTSLTSRSVENVVAGLESQRERDSDLHTRYHTALQGALETFDEFSRAPEVCRLLVWFSDGEHDDDNSPGFIARERDQIQSLMCGEGGLVDSLRKSKVNIVAAGLNADEGKLGLMRLIAQGGSGYSATDRSGKEGRVNVSVGSCGAEVPNGKYALAESADEIIDKLFEILEPVPGIPNPDDSIDIPASEIEECSRPTDVCNAVEFQVDESIASFQILAERSSAAVEIVLTTNEGQSYPLLRPSEDGADNEAFRKNSVSATPVTSRKVFVSVTRKKENPIEGAWRLEFLGEGAKSSRGTVNFVGLADISLVDRSGAEITDELKVARFKAEDLLVRVTNKTSGSSIRSLQLEFASFEGVEPLASARDESDRGLFRVTGKEVERALQTAKLKKLSSTDLRVQPVGDVQGLRFANGDPVPINFGSQLFAIRVSNGAGLPSFVRTVGELSFQGTPKQSVDLVFIGPDSGDGIVDFKEAVESQSAKANLDLIPREACIVPQQAEASCTIELIPDEEAFDQFQVAISVVYSGRDNIQDPVEGEIPVGVTMVLQPKASRGALAAIYLVLGFLVVQGLIRWLLAVLISRFAPLVPIARRVRLDAVVDSSGAVSVNPMNINPSHSDEGFALENTDSVQAFSVFGYDFTVSVLRTFMRSTVAPLGQVTSTGKCVIASRGFAKTKNQPEDSAGLVALTLRGQWVVGIRTEDMQRLLNGENSIPAEVVAFLEPYEEGIGISRDQQLSDLAFTIASSSFSTQFQELVTIKRDALVAGESPDIDSSVQPEQDDGVFGSSVPSAVDPFGADAAPVEAGPVNENKRKGRRRRRKPAPEQEPTIAEGQDSNDQWDPFS